MPALVILKLLKPDDPRNGELLTALTDALGWTVPLEARFGRIEIGFVGDTMEEGMSRVGAALDQAGAELGVDWTECLKFAGGMGQIPGQENLANLERVDAALEAGCGTVLVDRHAADHHRREPPGARTASFCFRCVTVARLQDTVLRHTAATLALRSGVPVHIVAARLGDDPKTVLSTYAHLLPQSDELAAERVAQALV